MTDSLETLRAMTLINPPVKVVHSGRNHLDVILSREKHIAGYGLTSACEKDDAACIKDHLRVWSNMKLSTTNRVYAGKESVDLDRNAAKLLKEYNIPHNKVSSYEALYYGKDAKEWMRIFDFIGVGPKTDLTMAQVESTFKFASTNAKSHRKFRRRLPRLGFLHSAIALGHVLHLVPLVAGDGRQHVVGNLVLVKTQRKYRRPAEGQDRVRAAVRSNQVENVVFDYIFEVWAAEVDRTRLIDCSTLNLSAKLLVCRLIFVSDVILKTARGVSVLIAPAID
jgi:hypothetical protein